MKTFTEIYQRAVERKGGEDALEELMATRVKSPEQLAALGDDRYLAAMTKVVFKAGFVWRVIDNKWQGFEQAFWKFNVRRCAYISPEDVDALVQDTRIVRHGQKIATVARNAQMIFEHARQHGGFGQFIGNWPEDDFIGLLHYLGKHASRLGGRSGQYFLRSVGKDGFILGRDGVAALIDAGVIDKPPTGKGAQLKVQERFNQWREQTGLGYAQISRVLACSIDSVAK